MLEFVLNDYHRNISDDELLNDLLRVASLLDKDTLTKSEYAGRGNFHSSTIEHRFENWNKALDKAGLRHTKENRKRPDNADVSNDELLLDLRNQAARLGKDTITSSEYDVCGRHGKSIIISRFSSWENALLKAGLRPTGFHHYVPDADLYEEIERLWISLGRQPTSSDIKKGLSRFSLNTFVRRFGSWRGALQAFINWINDESFEHQKELVVEDNNPAFFSTITKSPNIITVRKRRTTRDINLRLRFLIMKRDNFKCCLCGASPAKDPSVELHIDHIIPWSKGGETTMDNLRTLCSKCNLGKSDLIE